MKLNRILLIAAAFIFFAFSSARAQENKIVVGILPTYDSSGQSYGGPVSQMLTGMLYQQFALSARFRPIFLNPGGLYDPTSTSYVAEYVQSLGTPIDVVLATTFSEPETPKHGDLILHLKTVELDPKTGDAMDTSIGSTPLKDRNAVLDYGQAFIPTGHFNAGAFYEPSRNFDKQPLGKAAADLARQSAAATALRAPKLTASGTVVAHTAPNSCKMRLKINYTERHAISKSYTCIINDREESLGIKEGILEVEEQASPLLIQIKINDAPYKLSKQDIYLFDPILDCSRSSNFLNINIGPAGEAFAAWK